MRRIHGLVALLATAVAMLTFGAAGAVAATLTKSGDTITYTAAAGEDNDLEITAPGAQIIFDDPGAAGITEGAGCTQVDADTSECPLAGTTRIVVALGDDNDMLDANPLGIRLEVDAGAGDDGVQTGSANDLVNLGAGTNNASTNEGDDVVNAVGGGFNSASLGDGDDTFNGGDGNDGAFGGDGNDTLNGGGGEDGLSGDAGNDTINGGGGSDFLQGNAGADAVSGGDGFDQVRVEANDPLTSAPADVSVTLDDVANDGRLNEGDNIRSDVEDVTVDPGMGTAGRATLTGNGQFNILDGGPNNDTLDGREGTDVLNGDEGDDTINARDGVVDRIDCGNGTDTANVDQFDDVRNCETVNRADVAVATPDRQPTVAFEQPASNTLLSPDRASTIRVAASDDRGISRVVLFDEDRAVGQDTTAPYEFSYQPRGDDVGKDTLVATAVDTSEQASVATRNVRVDRFLPSLRGVVRPARDRRAPYRFRVTGGVTLPEFVTREQGCRTGFVSVQVKRGTRTISARRVRIRRTCGFSSTVTFRNARRLGNGRLKVTVRWLGNDVLRPRTARTVSVRAG